MPRAQRPAHPEVRDLSGVGCVGYCRVSTDGQAAEDRTSLADQRAAIEAHAAKLELHVMEWFTDDGFSGATVEKRPALRALLASCERYPRPGSARGVVLALNDSRFGRFPDPEEATYWRVHLSKRGWDVRLAENDDVKDGVARGVLRFIGAAQASDYLRQLINNTLRGMKGTAEQGLWSRRAPYGYRRAIVSGGKQRVLDSGEHKAKRERVALVIHEPEASVVRELFEKYASGNHSIGSLAKLLTARDGRHEWPRQQVANILKNAVYVGDVVGGRRSKEPGRGVYGKTDAHPAIVSRTLFDRVQRRLASNRHQPKHARTEYALTGIVRCAACDGNMIGGGGSTRRRNGEPARFYRCSHAVAGQHVDGIRCTGGGTIAKTKLEGAVVKEIARVLDRPDMPARIAAAVDRHVGASSSEADRRQGQTRAELSKAEARRDRLISAVADGTLTGAEAAGQLAAVRAHIDQLTSRLHQLSFERRRSTINTAERKRLIAIVSDFPRLAAQLRGAQLRELLRPWIHSARFDARTRELTLGIRRAEAVCCTAGDR